jgi:hypothetical protein
MTRFLQLPAARLIGRVPPSAAANAPSRARRGEGALVSKNSLPDSSGTIVLQSTTTSSHQPRRIQFVDHARDHLPVPLSPISRTTAK